MAALDVIFAKARFAVDFDCVIPRFGQRILLRDGRHQSAGDQPECLVYLRNNGSWSVAPGLSAKLPI
jgi:dsDNA-specific endonuclease/ATPase MutS2